MFHLVNNLTNRSGDALVGYFVKLKDSDGNYATLYSDANSTPIATVSGVADAAKTDENGMYDIYVADGDYDIEVFDKNEIGQLVSRTPAVPMYGLQSSADLEAAVTAAEEAKTDAEAARDSLFNDLASTDTGKGASLVKLSTGRTVEEKLSDVLHAKDFGAVGDGVADDTASLVALLAAMQAEGRPGQLGGEGEETRYLIDCGALEWTFDNDPAVDAPGVAGPIIHTSGRVVLVAKEGSADAPFLSIHNDPNAGSRYVHGGYVGPLVFEDTTGDTAPNRHGIELYGVECMRWGAMFSEALKGDLLHIKTMGTLLTGDAWHVSQNIFESLTAWGTDGWTLNNDSLNQFFNFNQIGMIWNIFCAKGGWKGPGAANWARGVGVAGSSGWAIDWHSGDGHGVEAGDVQSNIIETLELDAPEYGVRIKGVNHFDINIRFVHRYDALIDAASVWPKTAISLGGADRTTSDGRIHAFHYLKGVDSSSDHLLGTMVDLNNDSTLRRTEVTNAVVAITGGTAWDEASYLANVHSGALDISVRVDGKSYLDTRNKNALIARIASGSVGNDYSVPLDFSSVQMDQGSNYDTTAKTYTIPATGLYRVFAQIMIDATAGDIVRLGARIDGGATPIREARIDDAVAGVQPFVLDFIYPFTRGEALTITGYSDTPTAFEAGSIDVPSNNRLEVYQL